MPPLEEKLQELARRLFGDRIGSDLRAVLDGIVNPENRTIAYTKLGNALDLAAEIRSKRRKESRKRKGASPASGAKDPYDRLFDASPLGITSVYAELLRSERRAATESDLTIGVATILYRVLRLTRASEFSEPDTDQAPLIQEYLKRIQGEFGPQVERVVRETLQWSEINLSPGHAINIRSSAPTPEEAEADRLASFRHMAMELAEPMLREPVHNAPAAVVIRMSEWYNFMSHIKPEDPRWDRCVYLSEHVYIPLAAAYDLSTLQTKMQDRLLLMTDPKAYHDIREEVARIENGFLASMGKEKVTDREARQRIICDFLRDQVQAALPADFREPADVIIETRPKTLHSIYVKKQDLSKPRNFDDIFGVRVIVRPRNNDPDTLLNRERALCAEIVKSLKRALTLVEGKEDDLMGGRKRLPKTEDGQPTGKLTMAKGVKASGYEAVHCAFAFGGGATCEVQVTGDSMHHNNQYGTAAHRKYKNMPDMVAEAPGQTVSVFEPNGGIVRLPRGARAADYLAYLGANNAFQASELRIERCGHYYGTNISEPGTGFSSPLVSGDRVSFKLDSRLKDDPAQRQRMLDACTVPELWVALQERHEELCAKEQHGGRTPSRPAAVADISAATPRAAL